MTAAEFASRTNRTFTTEEYEKIEKVYTFHPCIDPAKGKDQIADLYETFGMRIILDMLPTAEKAEKIEDEIRSTRSRLDSLKAQMEDFKQGI